MPPADLLGLVRALGAPYGLERSVKITAGSLAAERFLISLGRAAFGRDPASNLLQMGRALGMPLSVEQKLSTSLQRADVVHFGYESAQGGDRYKIYFEYAAEVRRAMVEPEASPVLVHLAYKWAPSIPDGCVETRYTWLPCRTRHILEAKIRELVPLRDAPGALRCMLDLVSRVATFADSGEVLLMEVEEAGNARRSCDLNVYDAGLLLRDIADLLACTLRDFDVPAEQGRLLIESAADKALGHLSAGIGRDNREFVTIYFGVEGH